MDETREKATLRFARFVVRRRGPLGALLGLATLVFAYPSANALLTALGHPLPGPVVSIGSDAASQLPDHRFVWAQRKFAGRFGNASPVAIVLEVSEGTVFTPETLARIDRVTKSLDGWDYDPRLDERQELKERLEAEGLLTRDEIRREADLAFPPYPVNHDSVRSLVHLSTRVTTLDSAGAVTTELLFEDLPETAEEADERHAVFKELMNPFQARLLVSPDERAALITASFVTDRLDGMHVFRAVFDHLQELKQRESDDRHRLYMTGAPLVAGWVVAHAWEIGASLIGAAVAIFLLLWLYFRRAHGVLIPLIAATVTVIWGAGFTGWVGIAFDPLVLVIPMLITARAVSHTVQMAERFFEDYERLRPLYADADEAKYEAATVAMAELIVPGTLGIITDVAGLLVILVTTIPQMRDLGIFGAFWVAAIVVTVEILHPILICWLPAPREHAHYSPDIMARLTDWLGRIATGRRSRWVVAAATLVFFGGSAWITLNYSKIGESRPGIPLFWPDHPFNVATGKIGEHFGGADMLSIYLDGDRQEAIADQEVLETMEHLERRLRRDTNANAVLSVVPVVRQANRLLRNNEPKQAYLPSGARSIVLFIRYNSGPNALGSILSPDGRYGTVTAFFPDHKGETIRRAVHVAEDFIAQNPVGQISIRLDRNRADADAPWYAPESLKDFVYYMVGPLLPKRAHTLSVRLRDGDEFRPVQVRSVAEHGLPPWIEDLRDATAQEYGRARERARNGREFTWPDLLRDFGADDVDQWWEDADLGVRAVAVDRDALVVQDTKAMNAAPVFQPTQSWTRGVQFVMAGGVMGMLGAINEEVERSHLANISLIFLVIFVLHSVTYRSIPSGTIILLQISTATLLSLAYMAVRGIGLNINTLPVQAVGVGIGVDYAIYIVDRIRQESARTGDVDEAIRRAVRTTGMAVTFTATTVVGGIFFWVFSNFRFQAEMAQLLIVLMVINMVGAITVVPAFYSIVRPKVATDMISLPGADPDAPLADPSEPHANVAG